MALKTNTDNNDFTLNRSKHTKLSNSLIDLANKLHKHLNEHPNLSNEEYSHWNKQYSHSNQQYQLQKVNLETTAQNVNETKFTDT